MEITCCQRHNDLFSSKHNSKQLAARDDGMARITGGLIGTHSIASK